MTEQGIHAPMYSAKDVAEVSGLGRTLTQEYSNRDLLSFNVIEQGGRTYRKFSYAEVVFAVLLAELRALGIPPLEAKDRLKRVRHLVHQWIGAKHAAGDDFGASMIQRTRFVVLPGGETPGNMFVDETRLDAVAGAEFAICNRQKVVGLEKWSKDTASFIAIDLEKIVNRVEARIGKARQS